MQPQVIQIAASLESASEKGISQASKKKKGGADKRNFFFGKAGEKSSQ